MSCAAKIISGKSALVLCLIRQNRLHNIHLDYGTHAKIQLQWPFGEHEKRRVFGTEGRAL